MKCLLIIENTDYSGVFSLPVHPHLRKNTNKEI